MRPFDCKTEEWLKRDKYPMNILLVDVKKSITKKWLSYESPTLNAWMRITMEIYQMEQITAFVTQKMEQFNSFCEK